MFMNFLKWSKLYAHSAYFVFQEAKYVLENYFIMGDNGYQMRLKKILCIQAYEEALDRIMYITCDPDLGWTLSQAIFEILEAN